MLLSSIETPSITKRLTQVGTNPRKINTPIESRIATEHASVVNSKIIKLSAAAGRPASALEKLHHDLEGNVRSFALGGLPAGIIYSIARMDHKRFHAVSRCFRIVSIYIFPVLHHVIYGSKTLLIIA